MTIITQDGNLVNYDNVKQISAFAGEVDKTDIFAILAFDLNSKSVDDLSGEITDGAIWLGMYNDAEECDKVLAGLIAAFAADSRIYQMPEPAAE